MFLFVCLSGHRGVFACGGVVFKNHHSIFINRSPLQKSSIFVDFLLGEVYHNSIFFDGPNGVGPTWPREINFRGRKSSRPSHGGPILVRSYLVPFSKTKMNFSGKRADSMITLACISAVNLQTTRWATARRPSGSAPVLAMALSGLM